MRRLLAYLFLLAAATLAAPAAASAAWLNPLSISPADKQADSPFVAVEPDGDAMIAWAAQEGFEPGAPTFVQLRRRSAAGAYGPVQTLSPELDMSFVNDLEVDDDGTTYVLWSRAGNAEVRTRAPSGALGPTETVAANALHARAALGPDGTLFVAWERSSDRTLRLRTRSPSGTWSTPQQISPTGDIDSFDFVVDPGGTAVFVWERIVTTNRVQTRFRAADGSMGAVTNLSVTTRSATIPQIVQAGPGRMGIAWDQLDAEGNRRVAVRLLDLECCFSRIITVSPKTHEAMETTIAGTPSGGVVTGWANYADVSAPRAWARAVSPIGQLSPAFALGGRNTNGPRVAVDGDGDSVFTWNAFTGVYNRVQSRTLSAGGTVSSVVYLSAAGNASGNTVAVAGTNPFIAAWSMSSGESRRVQLTAGP
jgi:hypothetical protein